MWHPLDALAGGKSWRALADNLFEPDGTVRLPKLTGMAISGSVRTGRCFTRQPTLERCEAVREAVADRLVGRGLTSRVRFVASNSSWALYIGRMEESCLTATTG